MLDVSLILNNLRLSQSSLSSICMFSHLEEFYLPESLDGLSFCSVLHGYPKALICFMRLFGSQPTPATQLWRRLRLVTENMAVTPWHKFLLRKRVAAPPES